MLEGVRRRRSRFRLANLSSARSIKYWNSRWNHIFQILEKVGNGFSLAIGEDGLVQAVAGSPWKNSISMVLLRNRRGNPSATSTTGRATDTHSADVMAQGPRQRMKSDGCVLSDDRNPGGCWRALLTMAHSRAGLAEITSQQRG